MTGRLFWTRQWMLLSSLNKPIILTRSKPMQMMSSKEMMLIKFAKILFFFRDHQFRNYLKVMNTILTVAVNSYLHSLYLASLSKTEKPN